MINTHVFVVDVNTFTVHKNFLFCGVVNPNGKKEKYGLYADLMCLREGDLVFFYQRFDSKNKETNGFHGIYKIVGKPFFDTTDIKDQTTSKEVKGKCVCGHSNSPKRQDQFSPAKCLNCGRIIDHPILPNRIFIQVQQYFENSVSDDYAYVDHTDYGVLWTMLFRKTTGAGRARSIMHILPEEAEKLKRLLIRANNNTSSGYTPQTYTGISTHLVTIDIAGNSNNDGSLNYESVLHAWIMENIDKNLPVLGPIIGPLNELEYFGACIPYNLTTNNVDILCLHKKEGKRYKATVIEIKQGKINKGAVNQINDYLPWISQLATENAEPEITHLEIQPVIIGFGKTNNITLPPQKTDTKIYFSNSKTGVRHTKNISIKRPILLSYKVNNHTNKIDFRTI